MPTYSITPSNELEINFYGVKPSVDIRKKMKAVKLWWDPQRMLWHGNNNNDTLAVAKEICGTDLLTPTPSPTSPSSTTAHSEQSSSQNYALKLMIRDIITADAIQLNDWKEKLKDHVNNVMSEDDSNHSGNSVNKSQESAWIDCFEFIQEHLSKLTPADQKYELVFEYSLPGTVHERPDVFLLTNQKAISLEFKRKEAPQVDDNKDDVAQAIRYKEWLQNHHKVTKDKALAVKSYLVCTNPNAAEGNLRGIDVLTKDNFYSVIQEELFGEKPCTFISEWLSSAKTEMPDMLQAIEIMYRDGKIPYISDVNKTCLDKVLGYINTAREKKQKILILINGVPGAGKTAVGQSIVYEENKNGNANAVYLSGNGPLVEVLQYQINQVGKNEHIGENAIQGMKTFKSSFFRDCKKVPQQSILIFDEAQRAWDAEKLGNGFSEPEGLFSVGERIFNDKNYAVLIGLYGNGQITKTSHTEKV